MPKNNDIVEKSILNAAQSLLTEVGEGFTMSQLEKRSGISRTTIYRHIGNKDKLLADLAEQRGEVFERTDFKKDILAAARTVFTKRGLSSATIEQIATEAGVGVATVYRHFGDKEKLLLAFIEHMTPRSAVRELILHPTRDVQADLEKTVSMILPFFLENRDIFRLVFMGNDADRLYLDKFHKGSASTLSLLTDYFKVQVQADLIKKTGSPQDMALAFLGMVLAFAVIGPLHYGTNPGQPDKTGKLIVTLFLNELHAT